MAAQSGQPIVRLHKRLNFGSSDDLYGFRVQNNGGAVMPKIEFKGKIYNNEFEMPRMNARRTTRKKTAVRRKTKQEQNH